MPFTRAVYANRLSGSGVYRRGAYSGSYVQAFTPLQLSSLRAWYDAEVGQPKYGGAGAYVQLDGASGDYIFTPDSAVTSFSNDIEVVMRVKVTDWTAASAQTLVGKYVSSGNQRSWRFYVSAAGAIGLSVSTDGTSGAVTTVSITPTNALPDATWIWLRMRLDLTNGSNSVGTLETAADTGANTEPSSWTANGTNTGTTISGIFDSTSPTEIGTFGSGTLERLTGQVGRCIVRSGFDGTTVADFNASDCYGDGYTHSGGYRWTLGLPKIYDRSANNRAPATFGSGSNQPKWLPWTGWAQVFFEASTSNNITTPDSAAFDWSNGFTLTWLGACPLTGSCVIASHDNGSTSRSWYVRFNGTTLSAILNGTTTLSIASTTAIADQWRWWRVRVSPDNGSAASEMWLDTADATSTTEPTVWTAVTSTTGAAVTLNDPTHALALGAAPGVGALGNGLLSRVLIRAGSSGASSPVVDFDAALCGQSGYTGSLGNVFTVSRATSGRKMVVQSPAARSARSLILHGTDDWIDVPAAAVPALDTFAAATSVTAACRRWHNPGTAGHAIFTTKSALSNTGLGFNLRLSASAASAALVANTGDGSAADVISTDIDVSLGARGVSSVTVENSGAACLRAVSNGSAAVTAARTTTVSTSTGGAGRIGAYTGGTGAIDMEFEALVCRDVATTDPEHGLQAAYYGGGL